MSATNSPRSANRSARTTQPDPDAIDLAWAMGRVRNWLLGPAPLIANLSLFLFVGLGTLLWRLSQQPDGFSLPGWLVIWGILIAIQAGVVVAYGTIHAWRTPRLGPIYYREIPREQRTVSRRSNPASQALPAAPGPVTRPTWQGVLTPVTPFPTQRGASRFGTSLPAAPDQADVTVGQHLSRPTDGNGAVLDKGLAASEQQSGLADVRNGLDGERPLWRRWRRRPVERPELAEPPIDAGSSWLSPFPGARPVTRPAPSTPPPPAYDAWSSTSVTPPATDRRWPNSAPANDTPTRPTRSAESEQIPSLAAMLRTSNLTSLADAPIVPRPSGSVPAPGVGATAPMPAAPIPFSRMTSTSGVLPGTAALFAAFGIEGDGKTTPTPAPRAEPCPTPPDAPEKAPDARGERPVAPVTRRPDHS